MQQATGAVRRDIAAGIKRAGCLLAWTLLAIGSLLTFPSILPWMIAAWLATSTSLEPPLPLWLGFTAQKC